MQKIGQLVRPARATIIIDLRRLSVENRKYNEFLFTKLTLEVE